MFKEISMGLKRIQRRTAVNAHLKGQVVYVFPCNIRPGNLWAQAAKLDAFEAFDTFVNAFEFYNCNRETGRYASFWIKA